MAHIKFYIGCVLILVSAAILVFSIPFHSNDWHVLASMATAVIFLLLDKIDSVKGKHE